MCVFFRPLVNSVLTVLDSQLGTVLQTGFLTRLTFYDLIRSGEMGSITEVDSMVRHTVRPGR